MNHLQTLGSSSTTRRLAPGATHSQRRSSQAQAARFMLASLFAFAAIGGGHAAAAPTWTALTNPAPANLDTCLLLTSGNVMCHQYSSNTWHRLTPTASGSYRDGTWDNPPIPPMPNGNDGSFNCVNCTYDPIFFASAVLPDGRVIVMGGEYIGGTPRETNIGFIYDPVANRWSSQLQSAFSGGTVGDATGLVLQDGSYVITQITSDNMQVLNPATGAFTAKNPTGKRDHNNEENWSILYDGSVLTVDTWLASSFERYTASSNSWGNGGTTPVNLADTYSQSMGTPPGPSREDGPCALRPDNKLVCFSGNSLGQNALYDPSTNGWSHLASMDFPAAPNGGHYSMADGAAASLPNGNILVMASPVTDTSTYNPGSHFYELTLSTNTLTPVTDSPNAANLFAYQGRMLMLPSGEVLLTAFNQATTQDVLLYSNGGFPATASRPAIQSFSPTNLVPGASAGISGTLFNGFSEGATYGDDAQSSTNYPLLRLTNRASGHVFYARTSNHSRMGVEPVGSTTSVSTTFELPSGAEQGVSTLEVVANGIASSKWTATIDAPGNPRIAYWQGAVNLHLDPGGNWSKDNDCSSGAEIDPLTYCKKFYPTTTSVTAVTVTPKPARVWNSGSCVAQLNGNGQREYTCNTAPRISYWQGVVNTHHDRAGSWASDPDCTSGADLDPLTYCKKFYPTTSAVSSVAVTAKPPLLWDNRGCGQKYTGNGLQEWTCDSVPRIGYWLGVVNMHLDPGGAWTTDSDCSSGADLDPLSYCRKFYPNTRSVTSVPVTNKPGLLWSSGSCGKQVTGNGLQEYTCNL